MSSALQPVDVAPAGTTQPAKRLLHLLRATSFRESPTPVYPLASGLLSRYYIDCKMAFSYPEVRVLLGDLLLERIDVQKVEAVGGLVIGAYPVAIALSDAAYRQGHTLKTFVVRREPKNHGLRKLIEGDVQKDDRVVIVDDVITTGGSTIEAIRTSRAEGLQVVKAVAIIDREETGGRASIEQLGVPFEALFTLTDLLAREPAR